MDTIEESSKLALDFSKISNIAGQCAGIIPVAVQDANTREIILLAYTNEVAFRKAIETRTLILWSTSRNELWEKGKTSGETFELIAVYVNCEQNSLLYLVKSRRGGICHTKNRGGQPRNCFYRQVNFQTLELENIDP